MRYFDSQLNERSLRELLPNTSNPELLSPTELKARGVYVLPDPVTPEGHRAIPVPPTLVNGELQGGWEFEPIEQTPDPDPQLLWALILHPDYGLPIYQQLLEANQSIPITVLSSTLTGTWSNPNLSQKDKLAATVGALDILKSTLAGMDALNEDMVTVVQTILNLSHFPITFTLD